MLLSCLYLWVTGFTPVVFFSIISGDKENAEFRTGERK